MGWTAYYQVLRDAPLREDEIARVAELVRRQRKQPWDGEPFRVAIARVPRADRVIADGWNKLSMDDASSDTELLQAALDELTRLLGGELRVRDDFGALTKGKKPVDVPYGELVDPTELVAAPPVAVDSADITSLLEALIATEDSEQRKDVLARLAASDALAVVRAIYADYPTLGRNYYVRDALRDALDRLPDPAQVAREFLAVWNAPSGTYYYGDMRLPQAFMAAIGAVPEVAAQLARDFGAIDNAGDDELPYRRAAAAAEVLIAAGQLRPVIETLRARRSAQGSWRLRSYGFDDPHRTLAELGDQRVVPTLLLFLGRAKKFGLEKFVMRGLVRLAPERARPHVLELAKRGVHRRECIEWLRALGGNDELADQLAARAQAPIQERAIDVDQETRHDALRELAGRKDRSMFTSLVLAEALDKRLRARTDYPGMPFSWRDWKGVIPDELFDATTEEKLEWSKTALAAQDVWPEVAEILDAGAAKIAERYPNETLDFDEPTLAALEAEETAQLATL